MTADVPGSLLVGVFGTSSWVPVDPPAGMSRRAFETTGGGAESASLALADEVLGGAGPTGEKRTRTLTSNLCNLSQLVVLRPSTTTAPPPPPAAPVVPAVTQPPAVSGTAQVGQALSSTQGTWSGTQPITYANQWQRCNSTLGSCVDVSGATGGTYALTAADLGTRLRVSVRATNVAGTANTASQATAAVVAASTTPTAVLPAVTQAPAVSGTAQVGQALSSTQGTWSGTQPITYANQWQRCNSTLASCVDVSGATGGTYALTAADLGTRLRVSVRATNVAGTANTASQATAAVVAASSHDRVLPRT